MNVSKVSEIVETLVEHGELTDEHRRFLEEGGLADASIEGNFLSGAPQCLDQAFSRMQDAGLVDEAVRLGILVHGRGSTTWNPMLVRGDLLVALRDRDGHLRGIVPLGSTEPLPPGPFLVGREVLAVSEGETCFVTRNMLTQKSLFQSGEVAVCVPGGDPHVDKRAYEQLRDDLKSSPIGAVVVLAEPCMRARLEPAPDPVGGEAAAESPGPEAHAWSFDLARRLEYDGLDAKLVDLPSDWRNGNDSNGSWTSTKSELLAQARAPQAYLDQLRADRKREVLDLLGEGKIVSSNGVRSISQFPVRLECSRLKRKSRLKVRLFVAEKEYSPDEVNLLERAARAKWVKLLLRQHEELRPRETSLAFLVEELSKGVAALGEVQDRTHGTAEPRDGRPLQVLDTVVQVRNDGYWKRDPKTETWSRFSSFTARITEELVQRGPEGEEERTYVGVAEHDGQCWPFRISAREFESPRMMEHLGAHLGVGKMHSDLGLLRRCIHADSTDRTVVHVTNDFGWDSPKLFRTPSGTICAPGVTESDEKRLDLSQLGPAANLDLAEVPDRARLIEATRFLFLQFPLMGDPLAVLLLLAFGLAPVVAGWLGNVAKFGIHVFGPSGTMKSVICRALQSLYGPAFASAPPLSWSGTPYSLQAGGYGFKDAIVVIDDYKVATFRDPAGVQALLQNYADNTARSRLDRNSKLLPPVAFRGLMLSNGEDPLDASSSNAARVLPLSWTPKWCSQDAVDRLRQEQPLFSGFTRVLVGYLQTLDPLVHGTDLADSIRRLLPRFTGVANGSRLAQALALNRASFLLALWCAHEHVGALSEEELLALLERYNGCEAAWCEALKSRVRQMEPGKLFLDLLAQCVAGTPGLILRGNDMARDAIGFVHGSELLLIWTKAVAAVRDLAAKSGNPFPLSGEAVLKDLDRTGVIVRKHKNRVKSQVRRGGLKIWCVCVPASVVGLSHDVESTQAPDDDDDGVSE